MDAAVRPDDAVVGLVPSSARDRRLEGAAGSLRSRRDGCTPAIPARFGGGTARQPEQRADGVRLRDDACGEVHVPDTDIGTVQGE